MRASVRRWLRHGEDGAVMIETALSLMMMMTFVLGVIECCMMGYTYSVWSDAARQGVRYAILHGTNSSSCSGPSTGCGDQTGANVVSYVNTYAANFTSTISGMKVTVAYPDGSSATPSRVSVTINYTYKPIFSFPGSNQVFQVTSQGRILY